MPLPGRRLPLGVCSTGRRDWRWMKKYPTQYLILFRAGLELIKSCKPLPFPPSSERWPKRFYQKKEQAGKNKVGSIN